MKDIIAIFGAKYELPDWRKAFSDYDFDVMFVCLDMADVALKSTSETSELFVTGSLSGTWNCVGGIWRTGAIKPRWDFEPFLEILSGAEDTFTMVSDPSAHKVCSKRLRMLNAIKKQKDLPVVPFQAFISGRYLIETKFEPEFPFVVKIGDYQQGLMKWKVEDENQWHDIFGAIRALKMPVIIEEYVEFHTDYRAIFIGEEIFMIKRDFEGWKANRARSIERVEVPDEVEQIVMKAKETIGLDVGALDFVEGDDGYTIFEIGDTPDLDPDFIQVDDTYSKVAKVLYDKMKS